MTRIFDRPAGRGPAFSIPSIIAIVSAIGSFMVGAFLGTMLAIIAIVAGLLGLILALSPATRGGIISVLGIVGGILGIVAALFKFVF